MVDFGGYNTLDEYNEAQKRTILNNKLFRKQIKTLIETALEEIDSRYKQITNAGMRVGDEIIEEIIDDLKVAKRELNNVAAGCVYRRI